MWKGGRSQYITHWLSTADKFQCGGRAVLSSWPAATRCQLIKSIGSATPKALSIVSTSDYFPESLKMSLSNAFFEQKDREHKHAMSTYFHICIGRWNRVIIQNQTKRDETSIMLGSDLQYLGSLNHLRNLFSALVLPTNMRLLPCQNSAGSQDSFRAAEKWWTTQNADI